MTERSTVAAGLPRSLGDEKGLERLNDILGLDRRMRKGLIKMISFRDERRELRPLPARRSGPPGSRDRALVGQIYSAPGFRRTIWAEAYKSRHEPDPRDRHRYPPSLEHLVLGDLLEELEGERPDPALVERAFARWPDPAGRIDETVPHGELLVAAWARVWEEIERWETLPGRIRERVGLRVFALATLADDARLLVAAADQVDALREELSPILATAGTGTDEGRPAEQPRDPGARWQELCGTLEGLARQASSLPDGTDVLEAIEEVVEELGELEEPLRAYLAAPDIEALVERVSEVLAEADRLCDSTWLPEAERAQIIDAWRSVWPALAPERSRAASERLQGVLEAAIRDLRAAQVAIEGKAAELARLEPEKPSDLRARHAVEERRDELESELIPLKRALRDAQLHLHGALSPPDAELADGDPEPAPASAPSEPAARHRTPARGTASSPPSTEETDEPATDEAPSSDDATAPAEADAPEERGGARETGTAAAVHAPRPTRHEEPRGELPATASASGTAASDDTASSSAVGPSDTSARTPAGGSPDTRTHEEGGASAAAVPEPGHAHAEPGQEPPDMPDRSGPAETTPFGFDETVRRRLVDVLSATPPRLSYATHVARLAESLREPDGVSLSPFLRAALLADRLHGPDGEIAAALRDVFETLPAPEIHMFEDERDTIALLTLAATLRAALLAPASGALAYLSAADAAGLEKLYAFAQEASRIVTRLQAVRVDTAVLRGTRRDAGHEQERTVLHGEVVEWLTQAPYRSILYAPATSVWQHWLKEGGALGKPLSEIIAGTADAGALAETLGCFGERRALEEQVRRTDRHDIGRRAGTTITARALDQLHQNALQAVGFITRHMQLSDLEVEQPDFVTKALGELRSTITMHAPGALAELDALGAGDRTLRSSAAAVAAHAIRRFELLFDPEHRGPSPEPSASELTGSGLFEYPDVLLSPNGDAVGDPSATLGHLLDEESRRPWNEALRERLERGDVATARRMSGWMDTERPGDDPERPRPDIEAAEATQRHGFVRFIDTARSDVENALALGNLSDAGRATHDAVLVDLERRMQEGSIGHYGLERTKLDRITDALARGFEEQQRATRAQLAELGDRIPADRRETIERAIEGNVIVTANELLDRARTAETDRRVHPRRDHFDELFPEMARTIDDVLSGNEPSIPFTIRKLKAGERLAGLDFESLEAGQRASAERMLETWSILKRAGRAKPSAETHLATLLSELGFGVRGVTLEQVEPTSPRGSATARLDAEPFKEREHCPVPAFGSVSKGRYRLVLLWGQPTVDQIVQLASDRGRRDPLMVLYFERFGEARRRQLAEESRRREVTLLLLDETVLVSLSDEPGQRATALFARALPFAFVQPYTTTAGLVPPEMFYGRDKEQREVLDPYGSCFIYGGRQLGKTALLRSVERTAHSPGERRYALYMDLKGLGIGYDRELGEVWPELWRALTDQGVDFGELKEPRPQIAGRVDSFVRSLCERFSPSADRSLVLLLDEADRFLEVDAREVDGSEGATGYRESSRLKRLMDETERRIKVVFAGLHNVLRTVEYANHPLGHFGAPIQIGPLLADGEWRTAEALVRQPMLVAGYRFEPYQLITRVLAQTNYYPSLIQLYGAELVRAMSHKRVQGEPRYEVTADVLDEVYRSQKLRDSIRSRFHLTLQLDARYEVIAYTIAHECMGRDEVLSAGLDRRLIGNEVRRWWADGFADMEPGADRFGTLLDEMVGLGVLRETAKDRYTLRNANVLLLMGTQEEIDENLLRSREPQIDFEPEHFRARSPSALEGPERSPLTFREEASLRAEENGVTLLHGLEAGGLSGVASFLRARGTSDSVVPIEDVTDHNGFDRTLAALLRNRGEDTTLYIVPADVAWNERWVDVALQHLSKLRARGRFVRVAFVAGPARLWWLLPELSRLAERRVSTIALRPWSSAFLRQWMEDVGLGDDQLLRERISRASGNWPALLMRLHGLYRREKTLEAALEGLGKWLQDAGDSELLELFGLEGAEAQRVLGVLAQLEEATEDTLVEFSADEGMDAREVHDCVRWAKRLHLVRSAGADTWRIDPVVGRVLERSRTSAESS